MPRTVTIDQHNRTAWEERKAPLARSRVVVPATLSILAVCELVGILVQSTVLGGYSIAQFAALCVPSIAAVHLYGGSRRARWLTVVALLALGGVGVYELATVSPYSRWWWMSLVEIIVRVGAATTLSLPIVGVFIAYRRRRAKAG